MPVFQATCDTYTESGRLANQHVEVRIDGRFIAVSYIDDNGVPTVYEGSEEGSSGHFNLRRPDSRGRASLHRSADGAPLEGWWREDRNEGMWRITLDELANSN